MLYMVFRCFWSFIAFYLLQYWSNLQSVFKFHISLSVFTITNDYVFQRAAKTGVSVINDGVLDPTWRYIRLVSRVQDNSYRTIYIRHVIDRPLGNVGWDSFLGSLLDQRNGGNAICERKMFISVYR